MDLDALQVQSFLSSTGESIVLCRGSRSEFLASWRRVKEMLRKLCNGSATCHPNLGAPIEGRLPDEIMYKEMIDEQYFVPDAPRSNSSSLRPHVLLFALVYPPDNYSGATRPYRFSKYIHELDYQVDVLAGGVVEQYVHDGNVHRVRAQLDHGIKNSIVEKIFRRTLLPLDEGIAW